MIRATVTTKKVTVRRVSNVRSSFRGSTIFPITARFKLVRVRA